MADRRRKGKKYYGAGKIQRRKQLQLVRGSKAEVAESSARQSSESTSSDAMAALASDSGDSVPVSVTPTAQV